MKTEIVLEFDGDFIECKLLLVKWPVKSRTSSRLVYRVDTLPCLETYHVQLAEN